MLETKINSYFRNAAMWFSVVVLLTIILTLLVQSQVHAFTLHVVDGNGASITTGFRWMVEEDNTFEVVPQDPVTDALAFNIHSSYVPIAALGNGSPAKGRTSGNDVSVDLMVTNPAKRYFVSILPDSGFANSGAQVPVGATDVTVFVNAFPLPTAQISIFAFVDNFPINNAPDDSEPGLGGATITVSDAAGSLWKDAWDNPLGTTYDEACITTAFDPDPLSGSTCVIDLGDGVLTTWSQADIDAGKPNPYNLRIGEQQIKYLPPGKYGIVLAPPGDGKTYVLTSTIEGSPTVDAWVQSDESPRFIEQFGVSFYHTFFGFVIPEELPWSDPAHPDYVDRSAEVGRVAGTNRFNHFSRPPTNQGFWAGSNVDVCWVGLNDAVTGQGLYAEPCDSNSQFEITNIPDGTYELATWDENLDALFGFHPVSIPQMGVLPENRDIDRDWLSFRWFGTIKGSVYLDLDENGIRDIDENDGLMDQAINLRFRDGTIYQATVTDISGDYELSEVFPFFKWLTLEVDFARFKATGMTTVVDYGGAVDPSVVDTAGWDPRAINTLHPQPQDPADPFDENPADGLSRTETGAVLTQATQTYLNQTNIVDFGKNLYGPGVDTLYGTIDDENGGISGVVLYAVTRAEDDPRFAAAEEWEPGIPNVQVTLYHDDVTPYGKIDCLDDVTGVPVADQEACTPQLADVDNAPLGDFPGVGDVDRNSDTTFDYGDAVQVTWTDSWNDSKPEGCIQDLPTIHGGTPPECGDTYGTWNQMRPGIFDGGYAFNDHYERSMKVGVPAADSVIPLQSGTYIVSTATPFGYEILKEEDKNVDYGDEFIPSLNLLAAECVGSPHEIPPELSLFPGIEAPYYDPLAVPPVSRPLCNMKQIQVKAAANAAADFFFFTQVPKAARGVGFSNDDLSAEFNAGSPVFGEKQAPSWLPVSLRDWAGNEVSRTYLDEFGHYEVLVPSSYTVNQASPTGVTLAIHNIIINDPFMQDPDNQTGPRIPDPNYDPNYSTTPWSFQFETARTSYIDSPVVPTAGFVGYPVTGLDIEPDDGIPVIESVVGPNGGALVCSVDLGAPGSELTIYAKGDTVVPNPDYDPALIPPDPNAYPTITRDFGFGASQGSGSVALEGTVLSVTGWGNDVITATLPAGTATGGLAVMRDNGNSTDTSVNVLVGGCGPDGGTSADTEIHVATTGSDTTGDGSSANPYQTIQKGIDAADPGDRVLVAAGAYNESVILYKEIILKGSGEDTIINARANPPSIIVDWNDAIAGLGVGPFTANEMPAIMVLGDTSVTSLPTETGAYAGLPDDFDFAPAGVTAIIDGFTLTGATAGGGIAVIDHAFDLRISNNRINGNQGTFGGGITVGVPDNGAAPVDVGNFNIMIQDNQILKNAGIIGGGGVVLFTGSDNYVVEHNTIMGNLTRGNGAGISHEGSSSNGTIFNNTIAFNEAFFGAPGAFKGDGGGIFVGGEFDPADPVELGNGTGSVTINNNLIQGNLSGAGLGGGIRLFKTNLDTINVFNNMIVNNTAGQEAGGISLQDAGVVNIINNTIAHNDVTSTSALNFNNGILFPSTSKASGIVSNVHSGPMQVADPTNLFSNPVLQNNIVYQNRTHIYDPSLNASQGGLTFDGYWDFAVTGIPGALDPDNSLLTSLASPDGPNYDDGTNIAADPAFVLTYFNDLATAAIIDEGGNAISVAYTTLDTALGDYHIAGSSLAIEAGMATTATELNLDYDGESRPQLINNDIGADEVLVGDISLHVSLSESAVGDGTFDYVATSFGGTAPYEYRFWLYDPAVGWAEVQSYSATDTWNWDPAGLPAGTYKVTVLARSQGSTASYEATDTISHVDIPSPATAVSLTESAVGDGTYDYVAVASGGDAPYEYRFWLNAPITGWSEVQAHSTTDTWHWNPTGLSGGTYTILVQARSQGSIITSEVTNTVNQVIISAPATAVSLTESAVGDGTYDYVAVAGGGDAPYEYRFWLYDPAVGWAEVQAHSTTDTWNWDPTGLPVGTYRVVVQARSQGSTVTSEASNTVNFIIP